MACVQGEQAAELYQKIRRAFDGFYLDVGSRPGTPRLAYVFVFRPPLHLYLKRHVVGNRRLNGEDPVICGGMVGLPTAAQMLYPQVFRRRSLRPQSLDVPDGKGRLLECPGARTFLPPAPVAGADEAAEEVIRWDGHRAWLTLEAGD